MLKGWEKLLAPHSFVSKVHTVARDLTVAEDDELYRLLDASNVSTAAGRRSMVAGISTSKSKQERTKGSATAAVTLLCALRPKAVMSCHPGGQGREKY